MKKKKTDNAWVWAALIAAAMAAMANAPALVNACGACGR